LATMIPANAVDNIKREIVSTDLDYEIIWDRLWGLEYECQIDAIDLSIDSENNVFVIGKNDTNSIILKYDEDGNLLSEEIPDSYESLRQLEAIDLAPYMEGMQCPLGIDGYDMFVDVLFQGYEYEQEFVHHMELNKETGELFILGNFHWIEDEEWSSCVFVVKYEISGNSLVKQWITVIGVESLTWCNTFTIDAESNIYLPMTLPNVLVKLSSDGQIEYVKPMGVGTLYFMGAVELNPSTGNIVINALDYKFLNPIGSKMKILEFETETGNMLDETSILTPYPEDNTIRIGQAMTCSDNGDIFASSLYYE